MTIDDRHLDEIVNRTREDQVFFAEIFLDIHPFPYQRDFLRDPSKRIVVCAGRRVGKSVMTAARAIWFALTHDGTTTLIVSPTLRQSMLMFDTILDDVSNSSLIQELVVRQTRTLVKFNNGSKIKALPCGTNGRTLRGDTAHMIIMDEAAFIPDAVIGEVVLPMLATTDGTAIMISTPFDKNHTFYKAFTLQKWSKYSYPTSTNPLVTGEFLEEQRELVGEQRFAQEYLAQFVDDAKAYFPQSLLRECVHACASEKCSYCEMLSDFEKLVLFPQKHPGTLFGGYDPGGKGDPAAFVVLQRTNDEIKSLRVVLQKTYLQDKNAKDDNLYTRFTVEIADLHKKLDVRKIFVDQTGLGQPIIEHCKDLRLPAEGMTLTARSKQELLSNLKILLEQKKIVLPAGDLNLLANLNCIEAERSRTGGFRFSHPAGTNDDLAYALALAAWAASGRSATVLMMGADETKKASWREGS